MAKREGVGRGWKGVKGGGRDRENGGLIQNNGMRRAGGLSELIFHVAGCTMGQRSYMIITRGIRYCV